MKSAVYGLILTLLLTNMLVVLSSNIRQVRAGPRTWIVDDDGPADFTSIQEAVYAANPGDTVYVYNGTYYENIFIDRSLMLVGENKYGTIVDASALNYGNAVRVQYTQSVTLTGFTIRNAETGISVYLSDNNTIIGNVITNSSLGDPYNWGGGISLEHSSSNTVANNTISNTTEVGIFMGYSHHNTIVGNVISRNTEIELNDSSGIFFGDYTYQNIVLNNIISKSHRGIYAAQLSYNNTIIGNTISDLTIYECGINIWGPNNRIIENTIANMGYVGIQLNSISSDGGYGVPNACANNVVSGNTISNSTFGINLILTASSNTVVENNVSNDSLGILLSDQSENNTIIDNLVSNSDYGILLFSSNNTKIYHNSFIDNVQQTLLSESFNTALDDGYPSGGNYWSDYSGADEFRGPNQDIPGADGKGDGPYIIDEENVDHYPLMTPWTPPPVVTATLDVEPHTLNLKSKSEWITAFIELPEGFNVSDVDVSTLRLNETIPAELKSTAIGDYDNDTIPDLMVKFNRTAVSELILFEGLMTGNVTLTVTGNLTYGNPFEGGAVISVRMPGDVNVDCKVDGRDIALAAMAFGSCPGYPRWNGIADENEDNKIDGRDIVLIALNFGKAYP